MATSTEQERLEAGRELRRRGALSPQQEAALQELERRASAPPERFGQPRGVAGQAAQAFYRGTEGLARGVAQASRGDGPLAGAAGIAGDVLDPLRAAFRPPGQAPDPRTIGPAGPARSALQGATFGFGDEVLGGIAGAGRSAFYDIDPAQARDEATQQMRGQVDMARDMRPVSSMVLEGAGAAAPFVASGGATAAPSLLGAASTALRTGGTGLLAGGLTGLGEGEGNVLERMPSTAIGAAAGLGVGLLSPAAGAVASRVADPIARGVAQATSGIRATMTPGQRRGAEAARDALQEEGITFSDAQRRLESLRASGFDDATLADVGAPRGELQRRIRAAGTRGGEAGRSLEGMFDRRLETQLDRVTNVIERTFGGSPNVTREVADLTRQRAERARPLYEAAFGSQDALVTVPRDQVGSILERTTARDLALARRLARREGRTLTLQGQGPVSVQDLHYVKMALDDQIASLGPVERRAVAGIKQDLMQAMPQTYRDAASVFAGDSATINAIEAGRRALRGDAEAVEAVASAMGPAERELYQVGIARAVLERVQGARDNTDFVSQVIGREDSRRRIRAAFDNDEAYEAFVSGLRAEQDRIRTARFLASSTGSQTAARQADLDVDPLDVAWSLARGRIGSLQGRVMATASKFGGQAMRAEQAAQRVATDADLVAITTRVMQENDPIMQEIIMREASEQFGQDAARAVRDAIRAGTIPAAQQQPRGQ